MVNTMGMIDIAQIFVLSGLFALVTNDSAFTGNYNPNNVRYLVCVH